MAAPRHLGSRCGRQDGGQELELTKVTADPTEGEAMFESGCDVIGTVPMAARERGLDRRLVDKFHVEARVPQAQAGIARAAGRTRQQASDEQSRRER